MEIRKLAVGALCCFVILAGTNYLLRQFSGSAAASTDAADAGEPGGAAQFAGKHDIKDSPYFAHPDIYNMQSNDHLLVLSHYPTLQQSTGYSCGPVAANTVVKYYLGAPLHSEMEVCKMMSTSTTSGTTAKGMASYFQQIGWQVKSSAKDKTPDNYADFLTFVKSNLQNNTPIMVENIDWGGHWRVIIGYDTMGTQHTGDDVLLMADPFDTSDHLQDGYNIVPAERFFYMWFDAHLFNRSEQLRQWVTATPPKSK